MPIPSSHDHAGPRSPSALALELDPTASVAIDGGDVSGIASVVRFNRGLKVTSVDLRLRGALDARMVAEPGLQAGLLLRGSGTTGPGGRRTNMAAGQMIWTTVGEPVDWTTQIGAEGRLSIVHVVASREWLIEEGLRSPRFSPDRLETRVNSMASEPEAHRIGATIARLIGVDCAIARLKLESAALDFVATAMAKFESGDAPDPARGGEERLRRIEALLRDIAQQPGAGWTLDAIANEVGLSVSVLCRAFRQARGRSVCAELTGLKLDEARRLIRVEGMPIAQAAHWAGYASQANFTTAYRRRFGSTPGQRN